MTTASSSLIDPASATNPTPIRALQESGLTGYQASAEPARAAWLAANRFKAQAGEVLLCPGPDGALAEALVGVDEEASIASLGALPTTLPEGQYALAESPWSDAALELAVLGWALGGYRYERFKPANNGVAQLVTPEGVNAERVAALASGTALVRDLVNAPAGDMLPSHLDAEARKLADAIGMTHTVTVGDDLLSDNFTVIHAVGRASTDAPRLIDLSWGDKAHPKVTLVGKGVCFDSGGLNIKPGASMRWMKKDMGGAAHVLGLAEVIVRLQLPVRLRVLIPAVENAIAGNAYRPGDVLTGRGGETIEIDNTDAEGRLVLSDALTLAAEEEPDLVVDYATLTGAARVALGTELPAMFATDPAIAAGIASAGTELDDVVWPMPLHQPYRKLIDSKIADIVNSGPGFGGAITAALFLQDFVGEHDWVHFDVMAFNNRARPGRPEGGEAMGMRAVFGYLEQRYDR